MGAETVSDSSCRKLPFLLKIVLVFFFASVLYSARMRRNSDITARFPGLYRQDILDWRAKERGLTQREVARRANISENTIRKVFKGRANNRKVWPVCKVLNLDWA